MSADRIGTRPQQRPDLRWAFLPLSLVLGYCAAVIGYLGVVTTRDHAGGSSCGRLLLPDFGGLPCEERLTDRYVFAGVHLAVALSCAALMALFLDRRGQALCSLAALTAAVALVAAVAIALSPLQPSNDSVCGNALDPHPGVMRVGYTCRDKVIAHRWGAAGLLALSGACAGAVVVLRRRSSTASARV